MYMKKLSLIASINCRCTTNENKSAKGAAEYLTLAEVIR